MREINFDGLVGPSHNYAGLSFGNLASMASAGQMSSPKSAALQGLEKMRRLLQLGVDQGLLLPHPRPSVDWLRSLGYSGGDAEVLRAASRNDPAFFATAFSASAMWTANAATVSPAPDTADRRCHLSVANLASMLHRSMEPDYTYRQLRLAFADPRHFAVHAPLPAGLGDEGGANHMRMCRRHGEHGLEIFVYGASEGAFPSRQHQKASAALARRHGLRPEDTLLVAQSRVAIAAGAFHNDVVAVANENVLLVHAHAFADQEGVYIAVRARVPEAVIIEAPAARISLSDAIRSYLFNSQLVTLPEGRMALIVPSEVRETPAAWQWVNEIVASDGPVAKIEVVEVRESMRNGGGPACLRLRVLVDEPQHAAIDRRFLVDASRLDVIGRIVERYWPEAIAPADLADPELWEQCRVAHAELLMAMGFCRGEL